MEGPGNEDWQENRSAGERALHGRCVHRHRGRGRQNPSSTAPQPVWDLETAYREASPTRERISINGLWRWQPANSGDQQVPDDAWGHFKVPGCWPGITNYMQKDCQTVHAHKAWQGGNLRSLAAAWYQREISIPDAWSGRRIVLAADTLNSYAIVFLDGRRAGEMRYPTGELELTSKCVPGRTHLLSLLVVAMPLKGVMLSYQDSNSAREVQGSVDRRGLCGDVSLLATPPGPRLRNFRVATSVSSETITLDSALADLRPGIVYGLKAQVTDGNGVLRAFASQPFRAGEIQGGRVQFTESWSGAELWDVHTPENQYRITVSLTGCFRPGTGREPPGPVRLSRIPDRGPRLLSERHPDIPECGAAGQRPDRCGVGHVRSGDGELAAFAELRHQCGLHAQLRLPAGIPSELRRDPPRGRRCGDAGGVVPAPLLALRLGPPTMPSGRTATRATPKFYVARCGESSVGGDVLDEPQRHGLHRGHESRLDRRHPRRPRPSGRSGTLDAPCGPRRSSRSLDPDRIVYHHSSGNLGSMHTSNFYPNWVPIQEMSDWFEHWATEGVKPFFACEYGAPFTVGLGHVPRVVPGQP